MSIFPTCWFLPVQSSYVTTIFVVEFFQFLKQTQKNTSVTRLIHARSWNVPRSSSRLSCFWLRGEKDQHSEALNSVPDCEGSIPEQQAHVFPFLDCKLDAFGHISASLVLIPCLPHISFILSTRFFCCLISFFKLSPSVFPSVLILLPDCFACFI